MKRTLQMLPRAAAWVGRVAASEARLVFGRDPVDQPTPRVALKRWLMGLDHLPPVRGRMLVTALRNRTWIEWAVYAACVMRKMGLETTLVYRAPQIRRLYPSSGRRGFWDGVTHIPGIELIDLESAPTCVPSASVVEAAETSAAAAVAYDQHIEEHDVVVDPARYGERLRKQVAETTACAAAFESLLAGRTFRRFLCYSGLIGESPALLAASRAMGIETVCLEGWAWRPGHMIYNLDEPALEYNVRGWMESMGPWDAAKEAEVDAYLKFLDGRPHDEADDWLDNFYRIQRDSISAHLPERLRSFLTNDAPVFLAAPNVIGDSSMLRRETIFPGQQEWIRRLVAWFAERPHLKLVLRAHPAERWVGTKCVVHMAEVVRAAAAGLPNVIAIDRDEDVNTFSLIPFARAGLAWLSSAGVDFVVRGLPTMVAASPKYTGLGIVEEPATMAEYFELLNRWSVEAPRPSAAQVRQGKRYLHVVFKGFSFEAGSRSYRADQLRFGDMPNQPEHDRFFRIVCGDEPMPDQAMRRAA